MTEYSDWRILRAVKETMDADKAYKKTVDPTSFEFRLKEWMEKSPYTAEIKEYVEFSRLRERKLKKNFFTHSGKILKLVTVSYEFNPSMDDLLYNFNEAFENFFSNLKKEIDTKYPNAVWFESYFENDDTDNRTSWPIRFVGYAEVPGE